SPCIGASMGWRVQSLRALSRQQICQRIAVIATNAKIAIIRREVDMVGFPIGFCSSIQHSAFSQISNLRTGYALNLSAHRWPTNQQSSSCVQKNSGYSGYTSYNPHEYWRFLLPFVTAVTFRPTFCPPFAKNAKDEAPSTRPGTTWGGMARS